MMLNPKGPPGHAKRKARHFEQEIVRLHGVGYSYRAIREAPAEVGVHVSTSTVKRECGRHVGRHSKVVSDVAASCSDASVAQPGSHDDPADSSSPPSSKPSPSRACIGTRRRRFPHRAVPRAALISYRWQL